MPKFEDQQKPAPSLFSTPAVKQEAPAPPAPPAPGFLDTFLRASQASLSLHDAQDLYGGLYDGPVMTPQAPAQAPQRPKQNPWSTSAMMMDAHKQGLRPTPAQQKAQPDVLGEGWKKLTEKAQGVSPGADAMVNMVSTALGAMPDLPPAVGVPVGGLKLTYDLARKGPTLDSGLDALKLGGALVPPLQAPLAMMGLWDGLTMMSGHPNLSSNELIKSGGKFLMDGVASSGQAKANPTSLDAAMLSDGLF